MAVKPSLANYVSAKEASERLGVHPSTLRIWATAGRIDCILTPGKRFRYDVDGFLLRAHAATQAKLGRDAKRKAEKEAAERRQRESSPQLDLEDVLK